MVRDPGSFAVSAASPSPFDNYKRYFEFCLPLLEELTTPVDEFNGPDGETYFLVPYEVLP
jgi:hypothetical protein